MTVRPTRAGYDDPSPLVRVSELIAHRERSETDGCDLAALGGVETENRDLVLRLTDAVDFLVTVLAMDEHVAPLQ
jgi:hypothetical protein